MKSKPAAPVVSAETKMKVIYDAYYGSNKIGQRIYDLSDGYGEPGFVPPQGHDWSGIRDSSASAIDAMYSAALTFVNKSKNKNQK